MGDGKPTIRPVIKGTEILCRHMVRRPLAPPACPHFSPGRYDYTANCMDSTWIPPRCWESEINMDDTYLCIAFYLHAFECSRKRRTEP